MEAQYGDGSEPGEYVFNEAEGLEAEHTYPGAGGLHSSTPTQPKGCTTATSEACPDLHIEATVTYPDPAAAERTGRTGSPKSP